MLHFFSALFIFQWTPLHFLRLCSNFANSFTWTSVCILTGCSIRADANIEALSPQPYALLLFLHPENGERYFLSQRRRGKRSSRLRSARLWERPPFISKTKHPVVHHEKVAVVLRTIIVFPLALEYVLPYCEEMHRKGHLKNRRLCSVLFFSICARCAKKK